MVRPFPACCAAVILLEWAAPQAVARDAAADAATASDDIPANLARDDEPNRPWRSTLLRGWDRLKGRLDDDAGIDFAISYHALGAAVMLGDDGSTAAAGDFTLQGRWRPWRERLQDLFDLNFRLRRRDAFGDLAPAALDDEAGLLWGVTDGFSDAGFEVPDFYLRHVFRRSGVELRYGQLTIDSEFDAHHWRGARQAFLNQAFSSNPAVAFPRFGAGFTLRKDWDNGFDLTFGASNVQGTREGSEVDFQWDSGAVFRAAQLGRDFTLSGGRPLRAQLMAWNSDAVEQAGRPAGGGLSLTIEGVCGDAGARWFSRAAWSDGGAADLSHLLAGGIAMPCRDDDLAGVALGAGRGSADPHSVQFVVEGFYRWHPCRGLRITPDLQLVGGEDLHGSPALRVVAGLRLEVVF